MRACRACRAPDQHPHPPYSAHLLLYVGERCCRGRQDVQTRQKAIDGVVSLGGFWGGVMAGGLGGGGDRVERVPRARKCAKILLWKLRAVRCHAVSLHSNSCFPSTISSQHYPLSSHLEHTRAHQRRQRTPHASRTQYSRPSMGLSSALAAQAAGQPPTQQQATPPQQQGWLAAPPAYGGGAPAAAASTYPPQQPQLQPNAGMASVVAAKLHKIVQARPDARGRSATSPACSSATP
jgi:hypothetical protein